MKCHWCGWEGDGLVKRYLTPGERRIIIDECSNIEDCAMREQQNDAAAEEENERRVL